MDTILTPCICGQILKHGQWLDGKRECGTDFVEIQINRKEAERLFNNLGLILGKAK